MNFKSLIAVTITAAFLFGCQSTNVKRNDKYKEPVQASSSNPAFIFPVSLHGVPGNDQEVGLAITGGVASKYGASVISGQQLYSMVGNLSWTLGENMRRNVNNGNYELSGWYANRTAKYLQVSMDKLTNALTKSGVIKDPNFKFENVIVLHVDSTGGISVPGVARVTAFGGLLNVKNLEVISYIEKDLTLVNDSATILAQMPVEMNSIVEELVAKAP